MAAAPMRGRRSGRRAQEVRLMAHRALRHVRGLTAVISGAFLIAARLASTGGGDFPWRI
jgi:hypothetical protein